MLGLTEMRRWDFNLLRRADTNRERLCESLVLVPEDKGICRTPYRYFDLVSVVGGQAQERLGYVDDLQFGDGGHLAPAIRVECLLASGLVHIWCPGYKFLVEARYSSTTVNLVPADVVAEAAVSEVGHA